MKASDDLFFLIKSLNKSEKGYFKKASSMHIMGKKNRYMVLFDAIDKQEQYDEAEIKAKYRNEPFVKQLHPFKNYLYNSILWTLELYHQRTSLSLIQRNIRQIEILRSKGLFDQSLKIIAKSKKTACDRGFYLEAIAILKLEIIIVASSTIISDRESRVEDINKELHLLNSMHMNRQEYSYLITKINMLGIKEGDFNSPELRKKVNQIFSNPLLKDEKKALTTSSKLFFNICHFMLYKYSFDDKRALRYGNRCLGLLEQYSVLALELPAVYTSLLSDLAQIYLRNSLYAETFVAIEKLRSLKSVFRDKLTLRIISLSSACFELIYYTQTGKFTEGIGCIKMVEEDLALYTPQSAKHYTILLKYFMSCLYFGTKDFRNANKKIAEVINDQSHNVQINIQCYSRILRIVIFFEMKDEDALYSQILSTYRFLLKKGRLNKFETLVVDFFKKNRKQTKNKGEIILAFKKLKRSIDAIMDLPSERETKTYFNFSAWLESKIEDRPFGEIIRERAEKVKAQ